MFNWLKRKRTKSETTASPRLDFIDPDPEKFAKGLSAWRKALDAKRLEAKLDQTELNFLSPDALRELKESQAEQRKEEAAKKRDIAAKKTTTKSAAKTKTAPGPKTKVSGADAVQTGNPPKSKKSNAKTK